MGQGGVGQFTFPADQEVFIDALLFDRLLKANSVYGSCGLTWDDNELHAALQQFKEKCFAEFESLGAPAVSASVASGRLSRGDKHELALEWLEQEELGNEGRRFSLSRRDTRRGHIFGAVATIAAAIIAAIIAVKCGK